MDSELKDEWLDRLNAVGGLAVVQTCSGHRKHQDDQEPETGIAPANGPFVTFCIPTSMRNALITAAEAFKDWGVMITRDLPKKKLEKIIESSPSIYTVTQTDPKEVCIAIHSTRLREDLSQEEYEAWWEETISRIETPRH